MTKKILISGASIAGPTAALVLARHGIETTVVEKASALRGGGYPIDIRGSALEVVDRLGLLPRLRQSDVDMQRMTFNDTAGKSVGPIDPGVVTGSVRGRDIELPRADLADALYDATREIVNYRFDDSISELAQDGQGVEVRFASGIERRYDIVIGADGLHSNTRSLVFGPENKFERYIGYCFAGFSIPNTHNLGQEAQIYNAPGRMASIYAPRKNAPLIGLLAFQFPESPFTDARTVGDQRELTASMFASDGGMIPEIIAHMRSADDLYFDSVSQIRMPSWSSGRVALAGDAAHATSFLSGQGSSVALVSAYVLANELAIHDYGEAFANHERIARRFIEANQDLVEDGRATMIPDTAEDIEQRNASIAQIVDNPDLAKQLRGEEPDAVYNGISLPAYL